MRGGVIGVGQEDEGGRTRGPPLRKVVDFVGIRVLFYQLNVFYCEIEFFSKKTKY